MIGFLYLFMFTFLLLLFLIMFLYNLRFMCTYAAPRNKNKNHNKQGSGSKIERCFTSFNLSWDSRSESSSSSAQNTSTYQFQDNNAGLMESDNRFFIFPKIMKDRKEKKKINNLISNTTNCNIIIHIEDFDELADVSLKGNLELPMCDENKSPSEFLEVKGFDEMFQFHRTQSKLKRQKSIRHLPWCPEVLI